MGRCRLPVTVRHAFRCTDVVISVVSPSVASCSSGADCVLPGLLAGGSAHLDGALSQQAALLVVGFADPVQFQVLGMAL